MPIYEFYCGACNTLFNFFSAAIDTESRPPCPRCEKVLERRPARFAMVSSLGSSEPEGEDPFSGLDEDRLEHAMESLAGELEGLENEEDPRQMAHFLRRFGEATGMRPGPRMEEMIGRLERGEDPDALEGELGDELDDEEALEEWFQLKEKVRAGRSRTAPRVDETLYFL